MTSGLPTQPDLSASAAPGQHAQPAVLNYDGEEIFETLRDALVNQRLAPGVQLKEQALAGAFGVNRAVIRKVLAQLHSCKLVEHRQNRGMFVAAPSSEEGRDLFHARRVIEAAIVDKVTGHIDAAGLRELKIGVRHEMAAYQEGRWREAMRLSLQFHQTLARIAGNGVLEQFLNELVARTPLVLLSLQQSDGRACECDDHARIVAAIEARDATLAVGLMDSHLSHLEGKLASSAEQRPEEIDLARVLGAPVSP